MTKKAFQSLVDRLNGRLTANLISVYSADYDCTGGGDDSPGMKCLEALRRTQQSLAVLQPLVQALNDSAVPGREIMRRARTAEHAHFQLPASLGEKALQRDLKTATGNADWQFVTNLLTAGGSDPDVGLSLDVLTSGDVRSAFQDREITKLFVTLMRSDGQLEELKKLTLAIGGVSILGKD